MKEEIVLTEKQKSEFGIALPPEILALCKPVGSFAGTGDCILRVRNGYIVATDTGDQGCGQN